MTDETPLQKETRLTGDAGLVQSVDATLHKMLGQSNPVLARRVIGRFCAAKNPGEFATLAKDYLGKLDSVSIHGIYFTLQSRVKQLEKTGDVGGDQLESSGVSQGGILKRKDPAPGTQP